MESHSKHLHQKQAKQAFFLGRMLSNAGFSISYSLSHLCLQHSHPARQLPAQLVARNEPGDRCVLHSVFLHSRNLSLSHSDGSEMRQQLWDIDIMSLTVSLPQSGAS